MSIDALMNASPAKSFNLLHNFFSRAGIRQLQFILLKVALILGVEVHEGVAFESLIPPPANQDAESKL